jgi:hypothetical protein
LLEIQSFALNVGWAIADEDDLANEVCLQEGEGAGGPDMATAENRDPCVASGHMCTPFQISNVELSLTPR